MKVKVISASMLNSLMRRNTKNNGKQQRTSSHVKDDYDVSASSPSSMIRHGSLWLRILWFLVISAGAVATIIGCVDVIVTYQAKPITTEYHIITNSTMQLPSVHLCVHDNLIDSFEGRIGLNMSSKLTMVMKHHLGKAGLPPFIVHKLIKDPQLHREYAEIERFAGANGFIDLLRQWALNCEEVLQSCGGLPGKECCKHATRYITYLGTCFSFPSFMQREAGMFRGFTMSTKVISSTAFLCPNLQFCGLCTGSKSYCTFRRANIKPPWTSVEVSLKRFEGLTESNRDCKHLETVENYSEHVCSWECILSSIAKICLCNNLHFPQIYGSLRDDFNVTCDFWQMIECNDYFSNRQLLNESSIKVIQETCSNSCPAPCTRSEFTFSTMYNPFSTIASPDSILIDVFYASMEYRFIKQRLSMPFMRALTNLGGHLSLYLGVSLISMINVLFLISRVAQHYATAIKGDEEAPQQQDSLVESKKQIEATEEDAMI